MQKRRRSNQVHSLDDRLSGEAKRLRDEAETPPAGQAREAVLRKARQAETGSHVSEWLNSPGLRSPQ